MKNIAVDTEALYRALTESTTDDIDYYSSFVKDQTALELFAGFGRVSNHLASIGTDLETVELLRQYSEHINLTSSKVHTCDVLDFNPGKTYNRIFAAYNSFCLFTEDKDIQQFFRNLDMWLTSDGIISLSYYHPEFWHEVKPCDFIYKGTVVSYIPHYDLSNRSNKKGIWTDEYIINSKSYFKEYYIQIYESERDLAPYLDGTNLQVIDVVANFNTPREELQEFGWIDFILAKK